VCKTLGSHLVLVSSESGEKQKLESSRMRRVAFLYWLHIEDVRISSILMDGFNSLSVGYRGALKHIS
jgi:hypothetical protein